MHIKMFRLNSASEAVSLLDTFQNVIERIAYKMDSLPKYLLLDPPVTTLNELKGTDLKVTSLLQSIVMRVFLSGGYVRQSYRAGPKRIEDVVDWESVSLRYLMMQGLYDADQAVQGGLAFPLLCAVNEVPCRGKGNRE